MSEPWIGTATVDDAPALAGLAGQLGYATDVAAMGARLAALLEAPDEHAVFVARGAGGAVVGWLHVCRQRRVESDAFAEIAGLVVDESARGHGSGRRLVAAAETWAAERGLTQLRVRTRTSREGALAFYERAGFTRTKQQDVLDRALGEREP